MTRTKIITLVAAVVILIGTSFKISHWPGVGKLVWIADTGILLASVSFLVDVLRDEDKYTSALKIIAGFFILILSLMIVLV